MKDLDFVVNYDIKYRLGRAAAEKSPLPALLADLAKVEEIRIIEEAGKK